MRSFLPLRDASTCPPIFLLASPLFLIQTSTFFLFLFDIYIHPLIFFPLAISWSQLEPIPGVHPGQVCCRLQGSSSNGSITRASPGFHPTLLRHPCGRVTQKKMNECPLRSKDKQQSQTMSLCLVHYCY